MDSVASSIEERFRARFAAIEAGDGPVDGGDTTAGGGVSSTGAAEEALTGLLSVLGFFGLSESFASC